MNELDITDQNYYAAATMVKELTADNQWRLLQYLKELIAHSEEEVICPGCGVDVREYSCICP